MTAVILFYVMTVALKRISVDTVDNKTREKCLKEVLLFLLAIFASNS